ncbi:MAG: hypothetical protein HXY18_05315 [Bryobacteraceae bacterium]|nr:hypothetical protein [Bryobacteraceae bacterium]
MPYPLLLFDPRRTLQPQSFPGRAAATKLHDATETGFQISGIFEAAEDLANVQIFSPYDSFKHVRVQSLPVTDLSVLTLQYDMEILPVNGEEGIVRPGCVRCASAGWDKLTITTGAGDTSEVPLVNHAAVVASCPGIGICLGITESCWFRPNREPVVFGRRVCGSYTGSHGFARRACSSPAGSAA